MTVNEKRTALSGRKDALRATSPSPWQIARLQELTTAYTARISFLARVAADGTFSGNYGKGRLTGKLSGDKFDGTFPASVEACGEGHMQFERAK
jgi:hypothetical protein